MRIALLAIHKYASLTLAGLWLLQALTGVVSVFHRELDDWSSGYAASRIDIDALGAGLQQLQASRPNEAVSSMYAGGGVDGHFNVYVHTDRGSQVVRMDGTGTVLRERPWAHDFATAGLLHTFRMFHESLLAGDRGVWFVGLSGLFLLSNVILGLKLAWPRKGQWRRALLPAKAQTSLGLFYSWHRAAGLWLALPAMLLVCAGMLVAWKGGLESWLGESAPAPEIQRSQEAGSSITPAAAMHIALQRYPGAALTALQLPSDEFPGYEVRLRQGSDMRRVVGTTTLYIGTNGEVLAEYDSTKASVRDRFLNVLYPLHTGEVGGLAGRIIALAVGIWLFSMVSLGLGVWWTRRANRRA